MRGVSKSFRRKGGKKIAYEQEKKIVYLPFLFRNLMKTKHRLKNKPKTKLNGASEFSLNTLKTNGIVLIKNKPKWTPPMF